MKEYTLTDDFGRRTVFTGDKLVAESTDTAAGNKPQWLEVVVWLTRGGSFIVQRTTHYRIRHLRESCSRAEGYELTDATVLDTYSCPACNRNGEGGSLGQADRVTVDVYQSPLDFIRSFEQDGRYSNLARTVLADVGEQVPSIDAAWNLVVVP